MEFGAAADAALAQAMRADDTIIIFGEDTPMIRRDLLVRFGPERVRPTPISESAFLGAAVGAAMGGLRPVVEVQLVDFLAVGLSALLNEAAKVRAFSGGRWDVPLVVRATCGGGYGDGGQHEQALWGMLGGIPGLSVVVPSNPADAAGLMLAAIESDGPVVYLEHKLLSETWLEFMGGSGRPSVAFDVPETGRRGKVSTPIAPVPLGEAAVIRTGTDVTLLSLGVGVHRCVEAAEMLADRNIAATVVDLRSVAPLDADTVVGEVAKTGRVVVVDEDYIRGGLSGELAARLAESGVTAQYARVTTEATIPYARHLEDEVLPSVARIMAAVDAFDFD
jgi:pyruvate dehydrogenase E1 component beta subunit